MVIDTVRATPVKVLFYEQGNPFSSSGYES